MLVTRGLSRAARDPRQVMSQQMLEAADKLANEQAEKARLQAEEAAAAAAAQAERDATAPALDGPLAPGCRVRLSGGSWTGQVGWVTGVSVSKGTIWLGVEGRVYMVRPRLARLARLARMRLARVPSVG